MAGAGQLQRAPSTGGGAVVTVVGGSVGASVGDSVGACVGGSVGVVVKKQVVSSGTLQAEVGGPT